MKQLRNRVEAENSNLLNLTRCPVNTLQESSHPSPLIRCFPNLAVPGYVCIKIYGVIVMNNTLVILMLLEMSCTCTRWVRPCLSPRDYHGFMDDILLSGQIQLKRLLSYVEFWHPICYPDLNQVIQYRLIYYDHPQMTLLHMRFLSR